MISNFLSPLRTNNILCDQSTNSIINNNSYVNESLNILSPLYIKNKNSPIQQVTENFSIFMKINNEKLFEYSLNIKNNLIGQWNIIQLLIDKELKIFKFINIEGNNCIMFFKNQTFYIIDLSYNIIDKKKEKIFLEKLGILKISSNNKISINEAIREINRIDEYIINCGNIDNLDYVLDNYFQKEEKTFKIIEENNSINNDFEFKNNDNNYINKNEFIRNFPIYKEIYICPGNAFKYDKYREEVFSLEDNEDSYSFLKINKIGFNNYILLIEYNSSILAFTKIENNVDITINENSSFISFISQSFNLKGESCVFNFTLKHKSIGEINFIKNILLRCLFEKYNYIEEFSDIRNVSNLDGEITDIDIDNERIEDDYSFLSSKSKIIDLGQYSLITNINPKENTRNKLILQTCNNRTFVIKENNQIDIFKTNNEDDKLINISSINPLKRNNEQNLVITNAKMFNNDNEILFQISNDKSKLWQYDLNKGEIIQEWDCDTNKSIFNKNNSSVNNKILDFTYPKKLGQFNEKNEIIGMNSNNIFLLDGRINRTNKIVDIKSYSTNPNFKSIITNGSGGIAVGSENGDIRLFNEIGKNAKTLITGFENPIKYIESSIDGKYLLATCDKYIMVINTENEFNVNGFDTCFGRITQKPLILKLSHIDLIKYNIINESFTPAKFNNSINSKEIMIISSLGQYMILWNFNRVKNGETNLYKIINMGEFVIDNTTKFDKNQIIIALPDKLRLQNEKFLKD